MVLILNISYKLEMVNLLNTKDFGNIRLIYLLTGPECNMCCRHCHQTPEKGLVLSNRKISDDTMQFLDNFIAFSQKEEFIKQAEKKGTLFNVSFWGGEALLFWNLIKDVILHFENKYNLLSNKSFRFKITTNGLGINDEFVDFVNCHKVDVAFSYDAPHPWAVRGYVSDSVCEIANKMKSLTIISSGNAYNCDPLLSYRCLKVKFPKARYLIRMEVLRTFEEMDKDIDTYDSEKLSTSIRKLCVASKMGDDWACRYLGSLLAVKLNPATNKFHLSGGIGVCVSGGYELSVTLDGKLMFCYNSGDVIGDLYQDTLQTIYEKASALWLANYDPACSSCEGRDLCSWGCMILLRDKEKHAYNCEQFRKPFYRILRKECLSLAEPLTEEEVLWYKEQEKIMNQQVEDFLNEGKQYKKCFNSFKERNNKIEKAIV